MIKTTEIGKWIKKFRDQMLGYSSNQTQENNTLNQGSRNRNGDKSAHIKKYFEEKINRP